MSADTKWEAALYSDVSVGEKIRLARDDGDTIHGHVSQDGHGVSAAFGYLWLHTLRDAGYTVERAVPERTLPTEHGLYAATDIDNDATPILFWQAIGSPAWYRAHSGEGWHKVDEATVKLGDDLVRLVPSTEADELRQRIEKVRNYVDSRKTYYLDSQDMQLILHHLDTEANHV